jgi:carboxypeptidase T
MKKIIFIFIWLALSNLYSIERHHLIKIPFNKEFNSNNFRNYCLEIQEFKPDLFVKAIIEEKGLAKLKSDNINFEFIQADLEKYYEKLCNSKYEKAPNQVQYPSFFDFGSMGSYYKYEEVYSVFDKMKEKYPEYFVKEEIIGNSFENRPIKSFIFGDKTLSKPKVLLNSLIHAREGGGLMAIVYYMWNLMEKAKSGDESAKFLLNNRCIYIVPMVNPDGVYYNQTTYPNGGGNWRKNRRKVNDSTYGVDLNRNFGPYEFWNSNNFGSSDVPADPTYRGTTPFSEPETQAFQDYCIKNHFITAMNYHTYSNLLIYPYSAINTETPDSVFFRSLAIEMSRNNNYLFGLDKYTVGYSSRGSTDDWLYYIDDTKKRTYSFTPEVGNLSDGFWATKSRILIQCAENIDNLNMIIWSAESNIRPIELKIENKFEKFRSSLNLKLQNVGIKDYLEKATYYVKSIDNSYNFTSEIKELDYLNSTEIIESSYDLPVIPENLQNGSYLKFEVIIEQSHVVRRDTFNLQVYNYTNIPLLSSGILLGKWDQGKWGFIYDSKSEKNVLTDSPNGVYSEKSDNYMTMIDPIEIKNNATLFLSTYWQIEPNYDFAVVELSADNGKTWESLVSSRMARASGIQESKQLDTKKFGFHGYYPVWVDQYIDLNAFKGKKVLLRLGVLTDAGSNMDGIFFKEISVRSYEDIKFSNINEDIKNQDQKVKILNQNDNSILIQSDFELNKTIGFDFYDILGNKIDDINFKLIGNKSVEINISSIPQGFYILGLNNQNERHFIKIIK